MRQHGTHGNSGELFKFVYDSSIACDAHRRVCELKLKPNALVAFRSNTYSLYTVCVYVYCIGKTFSVQRTL